jgi:hypothetical protein
VRTAMTARLDMGWERRSLGIRQVLLEALVLVVEGALKGSVPEV